MESRIRSECLANNLKSVQCKRDRTGFAIPRNILELQYGYMISILSVGVDMFNVEANCLTCSDTVHSRLHPRPQYSLPPNSTVFPHRLALFHERLKSFNGVFRPHKLV
jgi:hypothetical protein